MIIRKFNGEDMTQNLMTQNLMTQNLMTQNLMTENLMTQNLMTENLMTQNLMTENITDMSDLEIKSLLLATGKEQEDLFEKAKATRHRYINDEIKLRGVIEISNFCQKNCDYCAMRRANISLKRFRIDAKAIVETAKHIIETGINTVFLQGGQDPRSDPILEEAIPEIRDLGVDVLLNIGERSKEGYKHLYDLGAKSFIMKYETSDDSIYMDITHDSLNKRIECMKFIRDAGMKIGTGNIIGLPNQTLDSLVSDIKLAFDFKPDFVSTAPFIPNKGTPLENLPLGDLNLTLNTISILRLGLKHPQIPAVSALEYIQKGGQLMGLNAGANVLTINFTPNSYRENYRIYAKDRFIVSLNHAIETAKSAGFKIGSKMLIIVFVLTILRSMRLPI